MKQEVILVLDCGATNVRAIAVNRQGKIVARASTPNASDIAMENNTWHQWSLDAILQRFADCCRQINSELTECHIRGIAVTTFGVDGALVDKQGNLLYPIISWKCPRTAAVMDNIERLISAQRLQAISGVGAFSFNTLYKLVWLKENHPQLLERAHAWLFISSLINHRLTGEFTTDITRSTLFPYTTLFRSNQPDAGYPATRFQSANFTSHRYSTPTLPSSGGSG